MSQRIREIYKKKGLTPPTCIKGRKHHTEAFHRIVAGIKANKQKNVNPYAVATSQLKKQGKKIFKG